MAQTWILIIDNYVILIGRFGRHRYSLEVTSLVVGSKSVAFLGLSLFLLRVIQHLALRTKIKAKKRRVYE